MNKRAVAVMRSGRRAHVRMCGESAIRPAVMQPARALKNEARRSAKIEHWGSPRFRDRGVGKPSGVKAVGTFRRRPWTFVQTSPTGTINGENALDATRLGTFPACHTPEGFPSPLPPFRRTIPLYAICAGSVNIYFNRCEFGIRALGGCCFPVAFFLMQSGRTVGAFLEIISESLPAFSADGATAFTPACFTAGC